jgi:hypothetical protein
MVEGQLTTAIMHRSLFGRQDRGSMSWDAMGPFDPVYPRRFNKFDTYKNNSLSISSVTGNGHTSVCIQLTSSFVLSRLATLVRGTTIGS